MQHGKPLVNQKTKKGEKKMRAKGHHSREAWEMMKRLYDYTCPVCGKKEPKITLTRDHIVPKSVGGNSWIENIQPMCEECNRSKSSSNKIYYPPMYIQVLTKR